MVGGNGSYARKGTGNYGAQLPPISSLGGPGSSIEIGNCFRKKKLTLAKRVMDGRLIKNTKVFPIYRGKSLLDKPASLLLP
jgi:hypothetical protein